MKTFALTLLLFVSLVARAEDAWKTNNEGFHFATPVTWEKQDVQGIDSHVGAYKGPTADLEFDEVFGLDYTKEKARTMIDELKKKEADTKLLRTGEEVWHVDGRICSFRSGESDPNVYGKRRFTNVASLFVPYAEGDGYLSVLVFYQSNADLPTVRRVLQSIEWKKKIQG
jgi:hypothetical protein